MSAFGSDYNGGFNFKSTSGNIKKKPGSGHVMYDDMEYDESYGRRGKNAPLRGIGGKQPDNSRYRADDLEEEFDDYRPGSRMMVEGRMLDSYESFRRDRQGIDDFDDDDFGDAGALTDDFDDRPVRRPPPRDPDRMEPMDRRYQQGRPYPPERGRGDPRGERRGRERVHDRGRDLDRRRAPRDYSEEDFYNEFDGIRGISETGGYIGSGRAPQAGYGGRDGYTAPPEAPRQPPGRSGGRYDDFYEDYDDPDGYLGRATIRDKGYEGEGVPKIFARYFRDDYDDRDMRGPKTVRVSGAKNKKQNSRPSPKNYRYTRLALAVFALLLTGGAAVFGMSYLAFYRTTSPLNVSTALTAMQDTVSNTLLRSSVDRQLSSKSVTVSVNGTQAVMSLADCEFRFSSDKDGTERREWGKSVSGTDVQYTYMTKGSIQFNETKVKDFLHKASGGNAVRMIEPDYKVDIRQDRDTKAYNGTLTIKAGSDGFGIDFNAFITELMKRISNDDPSPIVAELTNTIAPPVDVDKIYDEVHAEAADAYKHTDGTGQVVYEKEVIGVDFDKRAAAEKVAGGGTEWVVNLALTIPKVTRKALMAETFPDLLATYSTPFNAGNQARSSNLALAGSYINGTILEPGDIFSYNKVVGERTRERGFCKATVYSSEGTDEDYGGGICQTSSTLFYCAMKANLELVKRYNHLYTVAYMTDKNGNTGVFGNDATVNWPSVDMQFRNNKEYPIKIECITQNGVITFNIWGTWDGYTAEYRYVEQSTERYQYIYRRYQEGKKNQAGQLGREIWTYRWIFYQEDPNVGEKEVVDHYREFISKYRPLSQIKYVNSPPEGYEFDVAYGP